MDCNKLHICFYKYIREVWQRGEMITHTYHHHEFGDSVDDIFCRNRNEAANTELPLCAYDIADSQYVGCKHVKYKCLNKKSHFLVKK